MRNNKKNGKKNLAQLPLFLALQQSAEQNTVATLSTKKEKQRGNTETQKQQPQIKRDGEA